MGSDNRMNTFLFFQIVFPKLFLRRTTNKRKMLTDLLKKKYNKYYIGNIIIFFFMYILYKVNFFFLFFEHEFVDPFGNTLGSLGVREPQFKKLDRTCIILYQQVVR